MSHLYFFQIHDIPVEILENILVEATQGKFEYALHVLATVSRLWQKVIESSRFQKRVADLRLQLLWKGLSAT